MKKNSSTTTVMNTAASVDVNAAPPQAGQTVGRPQSRRGIKRLWGWTSAIGRATTVCWISTAAWWRRER